MSKKRPSTEEAGVPQTPASKIIKTEHAPNTPLTGHTFTKELKEWERPAVTEGALNPDKDSLILMQMDADHTVDNEGNPLVRFFGITEAGNSVLVFVHHFHMYLYVPCPANITPEKDNLEKIFGYQGGVLADFLKISVSHPRFISPLRRALENGVSLGATGPFLEFPGVFEANIEYVLRYMIDKGIGGSSWIELPPGKYYLRPPHERVSTSQIEADISWNDVIAHQPESDPRWSSIAPLRTLSFDIECAGRKGIFPEPDHDPVIQIGCVVNVVGMPRSLMRCVLTLGSCAPIGGAHVFSFETERELLMAFRDLIISTDPDILTGYNIVNFDLPYLLDRAKHLKLAGFSLIGRILSTWAAPAGAPAVPPRPSALLLLLLLLLLLGPGPRAPPRRSLYPSIMMAHNLCYSTLTSFSDAQKFGLREDQYIRTPSQDYFVTKDTYRGLLPEILEDLISARKKARAELKNEADPFRRAVLDGRQLALKISANSVYGFTGATVGRLPCLQISSSVTAFGRQMIDMTKNHVESHFTRANGYEHDARVIYGDTDSVMVMFGTEEVGEAMRLGREAADLVTQTFIRPIHLDFEKVYYPYLLINKKRYAGLYWTNPKDFDKMECKGIETVRRDNCPLAKSMVDTCLRKLLIERDQQGAIDYAKQMISDLLMNRIDMSQLVISKSLSKSGEDYAAKQAHVELAEKMRKRDPATAPVLGDRVPYVIIKGAKGVPAYEKAEDPLYVLENNLPIDAQYYLENQLSKPLMRIFEPMMGEKSKSILAGDHTRSIAVSTPTIGGLMKFAVRKLTCLSCKIPLNDQDKTVCSDCSHLEVEVYQKQLRVVDELQGKFTRLWTQCQRCQGSLLTEVLCTSRDCPIFYMRSRVRKDIQEATATLRRFDLSW
ncbi:DNA polymerase delta subunit 1 [Fonticula alba]|uniref:DNA polymerase n=1 Tax=Fonticula alba TaxID=691883 RepID=A0A058Z4J1_FONAL|nr:DNA polymerase delta subunit 1 [Fonticula alba]KCV68427.1 DNA polymerase delta subunit 1 [Fonticula alba]|eukprot:XP_009496859.1 DNA polymerase delta subunit 1 [Fonticula alba]